MENRTNNEHQTLTKATNLDLPQNNFPVTQILKVIGGKWKILLISAIAEECPARFGELRKKMDGVSQAMLTTQLRELERDGIICRKAYAESPPRVEYKLTELGKTLINVIGVMRDWWQMYLENQENQIFPEVGFADL
ncbi:winged helix-turn-helix transcriptional regulator [Dyadobacter fanqingshengii]|uniref:Helix-turn-helix transcriptional regulator n=1 Tax=Dyadobacter fanqingshengii TaxID=2906443 RepID=A0A9X1PCG9_9BACT|nr:helix-turn-helix domain-containing protein [Dyadobacter fanqingshengii]MCF0041995.1 helix-turn-helix transcriptional regulator [Dyadobacter fanqingshengii]USJ36301.1 helix-turn-helix transcriptional regulator [Dyadobacter fanqingshengii]